MFESVQRPQSQDKPLLGLSCAECLVRVRQTAAKSADRCGTTTAILELRWTELRNRESWHLCENADDGSGPSRYDATKRVDVSTRLVQSLLHWFRHIASSATTSCYRCYFMVTPLRHRSVCFSFSPHSFQPNLQPFSLEREYTVCKIRSLF